MTINIFVLKGDLNGKNRSGAFLFLSGILIDFSLTVKAATLICISRRCSTISSAKQGKSGSIYNLVENK